MADSKKARGRSRGRGRQPSPPAPGGQQPHPTLPQQPHRPGRPQLQQGPQPGPGAAYGARGAQPRQIQPLPAQARVFRPAQTPQARPQTGQTRAFRPAQAPQARPQTEKARAFRPAQAPQARPAQAPQAKPAQAPQARPAQAPQARPAQAPQARPAQAPQARPAARVFRPAQALQTRPAAPPTLEMTSAWRRPLQLASEPKQAAGAVSVRPAAPAEGAMAGPSVRPKQPSTEVTRAYHRGAVRTPAPAVEAPSNPSLPVQMAALSCGSSASDDDNGGVSVGRGHTREALFTQDEIRQVVLRPHFKSKIGGAAAAGDFKRMTNDLKVTVNYFELQKGHDWRLYMYAVHYSPDQDDRRQRYKIMEPHFKHYGTYMFDGANMFSNIRIHGKEAVYTTKTDVLYTVTVTLVRELHGLDDQYVRILNLILRRCQANINLKLIGRHYFNTAHAKNMSEEYKMRVFPGYQTSIRQHEEKILVNVDVVHKFQQRLSVHDFLAKMSRKDRNAKLIGQVVMAMYNHLTYRIDNFEDNMNPMSTFLYRGEKVTYFDYYQKKHQITIKDRRQPLIYSKPSARQVRSGITDIYLVPELVTLTGIPDEIRKNYNKMKDFAVYTKMSVDKRVQAMKGFSKDLLSSEKVQEDLAKWGLVLSPKLESMTTGVLRCQDIHFKNSQSFTASKADWNHALGKFQMLRSVPLMNWVVLSTGRTNLGHVKQFVQLLTSCAAKIGMLMKAPTVIEAYDVPAIEREIGSRLNCQLFFVVMDTLIGNKYSLLKRIMACNYGVLSQCVLARKINPEKNLAPIATKVAVQINAKLGGEPWYVGRSNKGEMVVGFDVYHDTEMRSKSYGAMVSSTNDRFTAHFSQVTRHSSKEELSNNFAVCINKAVTRYYARNDCYPNVVYVYRDGVGEGQLDYVKLHEIPAIKKELKDISSDIGLLFVVVCKRINTRIFADQGGALRNPPAGTVVDKVITLPNRFDFFLVSQNVTEGTASPSSYIVLEDYKTNLDVDQIQLLSFKLTHLYFNWQGTVRVPAPCVYAHKLAYMTGTATHSQQSERLVERLWYI